MMQRVCWLGAVAGLAALAMFPGLGCRSHPGAPASSEAGTTERVGAAGPNRYVTPANQILTPAGHQVDLPGMRPQALALSPNGKLLVVSGKTSELVILDPRTGAIRQRVALPSEKDSNPAPDPVSSN